VNNQAASQMPRLRTDITSVVAGIFALSAFTVALLAGLLSGNELMVILVRAIMALIVCYPVGLLAGALLSNVMEAGLRSHALLNPVPDSNTEQATDATERGEPIVGVDMIEV